MKVMDIIQRNFFRILRAGAFDSDESMEPMSAFKWRRLYQMVEAQNLEHVFAEGADKTVKDKRFNMPKTLWDKVKVNLPGAEESKEITEDEVRFSSGFLNRRLKKTINGELHNIDTSVESLDLLEIIVFNINRMLNSGIDLDGIIRLGKYLRTRGNKVDFVKIDTWLDQLHIRRMAQLQGSILMEFFGFEKDELPFVRDKEKEAFKLTVRSISYLAKDTAKDSEQQRKQMGFVKSNSAALRRNLSRSIRFYGYAPMETMSNFFTNLGRSLSEIEE